MITMPDVAAQVAGKQDFLSRPAYGERLVEACSDKAKGIRTRAQILAATCRVLENRPPQDLQVSTICEEASISNGTFYIYFSDRSSLLDHLLGDFVLFLQQVMLQAGLDDEDDPVWATNEAYLVLFRANRGLMRCLIHHLDAFPQARDAFHRLNREWLDRVVSSVVLDLRRSGHPGDMDHDDLLRRAYALGGMVDQYLSSLYLSHDPTLVEISRDEHAVLDSLSLIWKRGMMP